jgi:NAD-dependent dihydropyrimidine dehydrogenase PreA subunit
MDGMRFDSAYATNTLQYDPSLCVNCGLCSNVCPHGVFEEGDEVAMFANPSACMECGACQKNCPTDAIKVESGVGCASAIFGAKISGGEPCCGGDAPSSTSCC